jgi:hypothetical protein
MGQTKAIYLGQPKAVNRTGLAADLATVHLFNIFAITGGPVLVTAIIGRSRAGVEAVTTQTLEGGFTPTSGVGRGIWAVASANTVTITDEDFILTWSGVIPAAILVAQTGAVDGFGAVGSVLAGTSGAVNVFVPGIMDITTAGDTDNSGLIDWTIVYQPLSEESVVTAL